MLTIDSIGKILVEISVKSSTIYFHFQHCISQFLHGCYAAETQSKYCLPHRPFTSEYFHIHQMLSPIARDPKKQQPLSVKWFQLSCSVRSTQKTLVMYNVMLLFNKKRLNLVLNNTDAGISVELC